MKRCCDCKVDKPLDAFAKKTFICRECKRIRDKDNYRRNRNKIIEHNKAYNQINKEKVYAYNREYNRKPEMVEYRKKWREDNPEYSRLYYLDNKDEYKRYRQERRARIANNGPIELITLDGLYERDLGICGICNDPVLRYDASHDHIIPISKGGTHTWDNSQLAHLECNRRKSNKWPMIGN